VVKISNFQLYTILVIYLAPLAYLEIPQVLANRLQQNAWMAGFLAIIPGYFMVFILSQILKKSRYPFPQLVIEHLGQPLGKVIGFSYIWLFIFLASYTLRFFTDFIETNVLPGTPISIHIGVLILVLVIGIRSGIGNLARLVEVVSVIGIAFALILVVLIMGQQGSVERLLPLGHLDYKNLALATGGTMYIVGRLFIVLTLGFWCQNKSQIPSIMIKALWTYVLLIGVTTVATIMTFGPVITSVLTFPTFSMVTLVNVGNFIQNIDIIFIGIWILGAYGVIVMSWFMACYCTQVLFNLRDYKFLAAASSLLIGITSILISANILELLVVSRVIIPVIESLFFIVIPFLILLVIIIKSHLNDNTMPDMQQKKERGKTA